MKPRLSLFRLTLALSAALTVALHQNESFAINPHRSFSQLPTGNGYGFAVFDVSNARMQTLTEHPYAERSMGNQSRDVVYDSYFGLRANGEAGWLGERPVLNAEYRDQTQVIRTEQRMGPLKAETFVWSPFGLESSSVAMVLHVTNDTRVTVTDGAAYALMNMHLGMGAPEPNANGEQITWDNATRSFRETGPSGLTMRYVALGNVTQHQTGANNPYFTVRNGGNLDNVDSGGTRDDSIAALQWTFAPMAPGAEQWVGVVLTYGSVESVRSWEMARAPNALVTDEVAAWNAWRVAPPAGLSADETMVWRQSETVLRMSQTREPAPARGQMVAALPPGIWWITWVRDMSYAVAALARSGHREEAGLGVDFFRGATVGDYRMYVGVDYSISVVRYYGDGREWSDVDGNGPNIEFDGFGLAAWAARTAGRMELDNAVAPLRMLIDPDTGLIKADSGPWEVHWNGLQKRFGYTSVTAAHGLCATGDAVTARSVRDAILRNLLFPNNAIAGNYEELRRSQPARDAAVVEAINFGLIDPMGPVAQATLDDFEHLRTNVGRGYARNDDGGGYDSQEWVFIDLRVADALNRAGRATDARELTQWVTLQAKENFGLHAELYHERTGDYAGAIPMVGFGAGAYMLTLLDRAQTEPNRPECFPWTGAAGPAGPSAAGADGGTTMGMTPPRGGCAVPANHTQTTPWWSLLATLGAMAMVSKRTRKMLKNSTPKRAVLQRALGLFVALAVVHCGPIRLPPPSGDAAVRDVQRGDAGPSLAMGRVRDCDSRFVYPLGRQSGAVFVGGSFNSWSANQLRMTDGLFSNTYRSSVSLAPGVYQYKFIADGQWTLDPTHRYTAYDNGQENSRVDVPDCTRPELKLVSATVGADRMIDLVFDYYDGTTLAGVDPTSAVVTMNRMPVDPAAISYSAETMRLTVHLQVAEDNKYTFKLSMRDRGMRVAEDVYVPLWVEPEPFQWNDGTMYFTFTDRFRNGDPANDAPIPGVDMRANYRGGDLRGVLASLRDGYFRGLGVRSIWLSPVNANTNLAGRGGDGRMYSAYHGYWVSEPRTVEEHFGTLEDLRSVTSEAHKQGIRILMDIANNQLHRDHPYFRDHRDWFNGDGNCVCGGANCGWDEHRLDCWFTSYLPDVRWTNMRAVDQMADDALYWLTEADIDGFRVDAVKHMEHISSTTLRRRIHDRLEAAGTQYYLVGETFTGAGGHDLVQEYIGREELSGQFDFPLFWSIRRAFASNEGTMAELDMAVRTGERVYQNALMSPFLGNHDVERFLSQAAGDLTGNTMDQAWNSPPGSPDRDEPYERLFLAFTFLLGQPGVPLIYYGDEIGLPGAADPDNRRLMRFGMELSPRETRLLDRVRIVARARGTHPGLRRGARRTLHTDGDAYVFARGAASHLAVVAINRGGTARTVRVMIPGDLAENGSTLRDLLGGPSITVRDGAADIQFTPRNAALYVRE